MHQHIKRIRVYKESPSEEDIQLTVEESSPPMRNNRDETQLKIPNLPKEVWSNQSIILTIL